MSTTRTRTVPNRTRATGTTVTRPAAKRPTAKRPAASKRDRPISVVPAPVRPAGSITPHAPFLALVLLLAVAGLIGLVLLNTAVNENAFRLHDLETKQDALDAEEQRLDSARARAESPAHLYEEAKRMKLVPAGDPAFVVMPEGKVVGTPTPARAPTPTPTATPAEGGASKKPKATPSPAR